MLSTIAALVLAAPLFAPQPTQLIVNPNSGAPKLEQGVLSAPLPGELSSAVQSWALSQRQRYGLPAAATLTFVEAFSTRFGATSPLAFASNTRIEGPMSLATKSSRRSASKTIPVGQLSCVLGPWMTRSGLSFPRADNA